MSREFEWDERKQRANVKAHGVDFLRAARIFEGPMIEDIDDREDYGEERIIALGQVEGTVYCVIYTVRDEVVRIISAWKATKHDQERYYQEVHSR